MHSIASSLLDKILITCLLKCRRDVAIAKLYLHSLPSKNKGEKRFWKQNWNVGSKKFYCKVLLPSLLLCMRKLDNKGALKQLNLVRLSKRFYTLGMVFCYQNCSNLLCEKIVPMIKKNRNSRLKEENLQKS